MLFIYPNNINDYVYKNQEKLKNKYKELNNSHLKKTLIKQIDIFYWLKEVKSAF